VASDRHAAPRRDAGLRVRGAQRRRRADVDPFVERAEDADGSGQVALAHQLAAEHRDSEVVLRQPLVAAPAIIVSSRVTRGTSWRERSRPSTRDDHSARARAEAAAMRSGRPSAANAPGAASAARNSRAARRWAISILRWASRTKCEAIRDPIRTLDPAPELRA
jgi:hypothetical protein